MLIETQVRPLTEAEFDTYEPREFILDVGHPGTGKSTNALSIARTWKRLKSGKGKIYIIDTENGLLKIWKKLFPDLRPGKDIDYFFCNSMDKVIGAFDSFLPSLTSNDWLIVESMARVWDHAQDLGYQAVSGMSKPEYMSRRLLEKGVKSPVTPHPDNLWQIVKNAHDRNFMDEITALDAGIGKIGCNVFMTSSLAKEKPPQFDKGIRREIREQLGITLSIEGAPRLPFYPDTVILSSGESDGFYCTVLKDRSMQEANEVKKFPVGDVGDFWFGFMQNCRV